MDIFKQAELIVSSKERNTKVESVMFCLTINNLFQAIGSYGSGLMDIYRRTGTGGEIFLTWIWLMW